jgi:hypothetical protein
MVDDAQLDMIAKRLSQGRCIPFLGAAVNVDSAQREYRGLPVGRQLATELGRALRKETEWPVDLARAALEYEVRTDRENLLEFLTEQLAERDVEPSPALEMLARLPLRLIITTNYDRLLERALAAAEKEFTCVVQPYEGFEDTRPTRDRLESLEAYEGTIVYKIHGTFDHDGGVRRPPHWLEVAPGVTVTEDDYIEFLAVHDKDEVRIGVPKSIKSLMTPSMLLFLGYALEDWDFRTIYRSVLRQLNAHPARKSIAIQKDPPEYWVKYWLMRHIEIVDVDVYDFCELLFKRFRKLYPHLAG